MKINDRIKKFLRVPAKTLLPNPKNFRLHPKQQTSALQSILNEVGFSDALLARETPEGLMLIDGHARCRLADNQEVPVLILDVTEEEADKLLAVYDPISAMAEADTEKLEELLGHLECTSDAMQKTLDIIANEAGIVSPDFQPVAMEEQPRLDERKKQCCPECGWEW